MDTKMNNEAIIESIKNLCKSKNITASQLEKEVGLSQGLISKWQKTMPSLDKIIDIADYFHVSTDEVIGRGNIVDDEFIKAVYDKTNTADFKWRKVTRDDTQIVMPNTTEYYDEEIYDEINYFTKAEGGYLIMYCFSRYNNTLNPKVLSFYIQPSDNSGIVYQDYTLGQLLPLWVLILNKTEETPDDVKAENIKQKIMMPSMSKRLYS